ncbi:MAG: ABC transporter permease, partial [Gemmatimonadota bacterium]
MATMSPLRELVLMKMRTFIREPEALFWTFGFPILLAIGLGLAFREDPDPPPTPIGIELGTVGEAHEAAIEASPGLEVVRLGRAAADRALRTGDLAVVLSGDDRLVFRYDPARPESREARLLADAAVQAGAGGTRPVVVGDDPQRQPGSRYIDWLIPGLIGLNLMSTGLWWI